MYYHWNCIWGHLDQEIRNGLELICTGLGVSYDCSVSPLGTFFLVNTTEENDSLFWKEAKLLGNRTFPQVDLKAIAECPSEENNQLNVFTDVLPVFGDLG